VQVYSAQTDRPEGQQGFVGAIGFHIARSGIAEVGRVEHDPAGGYVPPIRRSIVIGDRLFTISDGGVMASGLAALDRRAFVAFPEPAPQPGPEPAQPAPR
jgi:hypothetical protein